MTNKSEADRPNANTAAQHERVSQGLVETLGILDEVLEPGRVRCRLHTGLSHQNIQGIVHGSVPMALLDTAMGHALDSLLEEGEFCATTQISFQFQHAVRPGDVLEAVGEVIKRGRRVVFLQGICRNADSTVVANAHGTWYVGTKRA